MAIEPETQMRRFVQSICRGCKGPSPRKTAPRRVTVAATMLIVSCKTRNFLTLRKTCLPHLIVLRMEEKLSSKKMMSAASLATWFEVPAIARQISAFLMASLSLVPLPATATTCPHCFRTQVSTYLSSSDALKMILRESLMILKLSSAVFLPYSDYLMIPPQRSLKSQP